MLGGFTASQTCQEMNKDQQPMQLKNILAGFESSYTSLTVLEVQKEPGRR